MCTAEVDCFNVYVYLFIHRGSVAVVAELRKYTLAMMPSVRFELGWTNIALVVHAVGF